MMSPWPMCPSLDRIQDVGNDWWLLTGGFLEFFMCCIQHCFICRPSIVSEDVGIEPRTVATSALALRRSNHRLHLIHWSFLGSSASLLSFNVDSRLSMLAEWKLLFRKIFPSAGRLKLRLAGSRWHCYFTQWRCSVMVSVPSLLIFVLHDVSCQAMIAASQEWRMKKIMEKSLHS